MLEVRPPLVMLGVEMVERSAPIVATTPTDPDPKVVKGLLP
jgi:hypothetical protein